MQVGRKALKWPKHLIVMVTVMILKMVEFLLIARESIQKKNENMRSLAGMGHSSASITGIAELGLKTRDSENGGMIIPIFISFSKNQN